MISRRPRSWLYVPGDQPELLAKAGSRGADALIADLEDAVAPAAKQTARDMVADWLTGLDNSGLDRAPASGLAGRQIWVRVNADTVDDDIVAVAHPRLAGVVVAKATVDVMGSAASALQQRRARLGLDRDFAVVGLIESGQGLMDAAQIAAGPQVANLALGEADLAAELGLDPSADQRELWPYRAVVVAASAAAGIAPPTGPVSTDFRDLEALASGCETLRRQGFRSRSAIHPAQVKVINAAFTPSPAKVASAQDVLARLDAADGGATVAADGRMIDEAVARSAREVLSRTPLDQEG